MPCVQEVQHLAECRIAWIVPCYSTRVEPDDIQIRHLAWEDLYIPELVEAALATADQYEDWELEIQIRAHAVYCANFFNPN